MATKTRLRLLAALSMVGVVSACGGPLHYRDVAGYAGYRAWWGDYSGGAALVRSNLEELEAEGRSPYDIAWTLGHLSFLCWATGEVDEALRLAERAVREAERLTPESEALLAATLVEMGRARLANHEYDRARRNCERALSLDDRFWWDTGTARLCVGEAALALGDLPAARSNIARAYEIRSDMQGPYSWPAAEALALMAVLRQETGEFDRAERDFERALDDIAWSHPSPSPYEARALESYARFLEGRGRVEDAQRARDRATAVRSELGSCKS